MAEEEKEEKTEAAPPAASKKKLVIGIAAGVVLLLVVLVAFFMFSGKSGKSDVKETAVDEAADTAHRGAPEGKDDEEELAEGEEPIGAIFPIETFVVNLDGGKYLRCQIQLEFADREVPRRFYSKLVPVRDGIITLLSNHKYDDAVSQKGRDTIRSEVKELVNEMMKKEDVKQVYFTQYVVQ